MKSFKRMKLAMAVSAALALGSTAANASLVLVSPTDVNGAGLGAVNTVLTITSPANTTTETGSVGLNTSGVQVTSGNTQAQTQVRSLSTVGVNSASSLRVVFNASEPGGDSINLNNLVLTIYSPTGTPLFNSGAFTGQTFANTQTGTGNAGFVFALDAAQQAQATTAGAFSSTNNVIGLSASASDATGGLETFFVAPSITAAVPEPETYGMLLSGLGLLGFIASRRRSKK